MKNTMIMSYFLLLTGSCEMKPARKEAAEQIPAEQEAAAACTDNCEAGESVTALSCKLTTPELQQRKATVLASLRKQVQSKKELPDGYAFTFPGTDAMLDELNEFIKTERMCCDFFTFTLSVSGDQQKSVLAITGPGGAKEFITTELEL